MATILGIDPGRHEAAALLEVAPGGVIDGWRLFDTLGEIGPLLEAAMDAELVVIEAQHASPQMGVASAFALGAAYGWWLGLLTTAPPRMVTRIEPAVWRGAFGLKGKADGIAMARAVIGAPTQALRHDEADAILLAWWGWRTVLSKAG